MQWQNRIVRQNGCAPMQTNVHKHRKTTVKKKYKAVWALRLRDMSKDYVTLLSLNLLSYLHLLNISECLLMLVRRSAFKIANFSSKHRLQDLAPLKLAEACFVTIGSNIPRNAMQSSYPRPSGKKKTADCPQKSHGKLQSKPLPT